MYKNVIFDYSDTLFHFKAREYLTDLMQGDQENARRLHAALFECPLWLSFDYGLISRDEHKRQALQSLSPEDRAIADIYLDHWHEHYEPIEGMPEIVEELKNRGIRLYVLSNFPETFELVYAQRELLHRFDGRLISYEAGTGKDDPAFFQRLLKKYDLKAEECMYFDDYPRFIKVARALGIDGHTFTNAADVRRILGI